MFGVTSSDFTSTAVSELSIDPITVPELTGAITDKLGTIDFFTASTNRNGLLYYNGTAHSSKLTAPFIIAHNDLPNLQ